MIPKSDLTNTSDVSESLQQIEAPSEDEKSQVFGLSVYPINMQSLFIQTSPSFHVSNLKLYCKNRKRNLRLMEYVDINYNKY